MSKKKLNANPLIGGGVGTIETCSAVVTYVQETLTLSNTLHEDNPTGGLSPEAVTGLYFILEAVTRALDYEAENRGAKS